MIKPKTALPEKRESKGNRRGIGNLSRFHEDTDSLAQMKGLKEIKQTHPQTEKENPQVRKCGAERIKNTQQDLKLYGSKHLEEAFFLT